MSDAQFIAQLILSNILMVMFFSAGRLIYLAVRPPKSEERSYKINTYGCMAILIAGFLLGLAFGGLMVALKSPAGDAGNVPEGYYYVGPVLDDSHTGFCGCTPDIIIETE